MNAINDPILARRPDPLSPALYPAAREAFGSASKPGDLPARPGTPARAEPKSRGDAPREAGAAATSPGAGAASDNIPEDAGEPVEHTLRRTGRKPVRFKGHQIMEALGQRGRGTVRYDINLYRSVAGRIVVEATARREALGEQDLFRVKTFDTLPAAACWLEAYRCIDDVPVPPGLCGAETPLPWTVLQAVQLRQQIECIEADYHALVSEILVALDVADADEVEEPQSPGNRFAPAM